MNRTPGLRRRTPGALLPLYNSPANRPHRECEQGIAPGTQRFFAQSHGVWSAASVTRGADVARYHADLVCELSRTVGREPIVSARPISSVAAALSAAEIPALAEGA
jgi:hypothetical protein